MQKITACLPPALFLESLKLFYFGRFSDLLLLWMSFPFPQEQWKKYDPKIFGGALQQRVCSGFSPDSLFSVFPD